MVPILSQVLLRARCRYCGKKIAWRYAYIEFLTGVLFVLVGLKPGLIEGGYLTGIFVGDWVVLLRDLVVVSCLVVVFWIDLETLMIPLSSALLIGLAGVMSDAWSISQGKAMTTAPLGFFDALPSALPESLVAMVTAASLVWMLRAVASAIYKQEAMGFGDVFLVAAIGANIGWNAGLLTFFFLSAVLGAIIGLLLRVPHAVRAYRRGKVRSAKRKSKRSLAWPLARRAIRLEMPFGPMLAIGAFITILYGPRLNEAYIRWAAPELISHRDAVRSNSTVLPAARGAGTNVLQSSFKRHA